MKHEITEIKEDFLPLIEKIRDSEVFRHKQWYKYPKDALQAEFIEWYFKNTLNLEFTEDKSHFRVIDYDTYEIDQFLKTNGRKKTTAFTDAMTDEAVAKQKAYWQEYHKNNPDQRTPGFMMRMSGQELKESASKIISDLNNSDLDDLDGL